MSATRQGRGRGPAAGQTPEPGQAAASPLAPGLARRRQATVDPGRVYLGWQHALPQPDPGPMPRRPAPPVLEQLSPGWLAAQRREENRLSRPPKLACLAGLVLAGAVLAMWLTGLLNAALAVIGLAVFLAAAAGGARAVWRGEQQLRACIEAEEQRIAKISAAQQSRQAARLELHAAAYRDWERRRAVFDRQPQWYAVSLPAQIDRVDVAGGTLPGWSAMLTMIAAPRLSTGGEVTVLDLTEGSVARDLLAVASRSGIEPLVWVMPGDLPLLDLGTGLGPEALADVLAQTVCASDEEGTAGDPAKDSAILDRVLEVLGGEARIAHVTAALRVLAQVGDPREDLRGGLLTAGQLERITTLFGRSAADRVVTERAWALESRLRKLEQLGSAPVSMPPSRLRVAWLDRRSGALGNKVLGTYVTVALTHMLRQAPAGRPWQHTLFVLGAERLRAEVLDRLEDACQTSGTGLVMAYRSIPAQVAARLGRGNASVAFMRLGNAQDAKFASEQIGTEHRFVLSQLTDTVGTSMTDTVGDSYTSTVGTADSVAGSVSVSSTSGRSRGRGRSRQGTFAPFGDFTGTASRDASVSSGTSDSLSITEGINSGTSWGVSTSAAVGTNASLARTSQRSREFLVEQHELQQLPTSAMIITYAAREGRRVVLADANPGIITLPTATLLSLDEAQAAAHGRRARAGWRPGSGGPESGRPGSGGAGAGESAPGTRGPGMPETGAQGRPAPDVPAETWPWPASRRAGDEPAAPPNLGRPPDRLDWRRPRS